MLHVRANGGESGGEDVKDLVECDARVSDGEDGKLHLSLVLSEGRDEVGAFSVFFEI